MMTYIHIIIIIKQIKVHINESVHSVEHSVEEIKEGMTIHS